jgi:hypothetical protein
MVQPDDPQPDPGSLFCRVEYLTSALRRLEQRPARFSHPISIKSITCIGSRLRPPAS